uniref:Uncharacterized protein n=1 Tax=Pelusios castaneus TaxID=367368 RepID=A0A8C8SMZ8_9SAUR
MPQEIGLTPNHECVSHTDAAPFYPSNISLVSYTYSVLVGVEAVPVKGTLIRKYLVIPESLGLGSSWLYVLVLRGTPALNPAFAMLTIFSGRAVAPVSACQLTMKKLIWGIIFLKTKTQEICSPPLFFISLDFVLQAFFPYTLNQEKCI